ncbi:hypothetical protein PTKIN_Ptkin11bG0193800 [Pterospermum kingtungense]
MWRPYQFFCLVWFFLFLQANLLPLSSSSTIQLCSKDEAKSLIQFKSSFSTVGSDFVTWNCDHVGTKSYPKTDSWKEGTECCSWDGVTCDNVGGGVIGLDLSCSWLYGTLPSNSSLFQLQHLQRLNLAFNNFDSSEMSSEFGEFESLEYLNLSNTFLSGKVPSQVSHLSKLVSLDLSGNDYQTLDRHTLRGLVQNLTKVRHLFLDGIQMPSVNPNVFRNLSSSLRSLSLNNCGLRGKFPENIFQLPDLKLLKLGNIDKLSLNLSQFNRSSPLEVLDLSYMSFSTELFDSIGNLLSLEHLVISDADFSGRLPDSIGNLVSMRYLNLRESNLWGSIPKSIGNLWQLEFLDISNNFFTGQIPSSLTNLTQVESLSIWDNQLEGSIPDEVNAFPNLDTLDLSLNSLNGTLPSWLYNISSLNYIDLSLNQLHGHIKEFQYKSLEVINFQNNKLHGPIPASISQLLNLTTLDLSSNNLSGNVDIGMFSKLQNLQYLSLQYNSLSLNSNGTSADYTLPNLKYLYLSSCNLGEVPQIFRASKSLAYLDLSNNGIYGKIPMWMWDVGKDTLSYLNLSHNSLTDFEQLPWKEIHILDLSFNLIHGNLPVPPSATRIFLISNNKLSGEISSRICNGSFLEILDLSYNNLSGAIPQCLGGLTQSVWLLNLQMNKFAGIIPPTFAKGCRLSNLDLNGNQLEGPITRSIMNCRGLEVLDIGNNKINDTFPHWLGRLPQLQVLVLKSNRMHGSIRSMRSNLSFSKIQIFDLSSNYFTGALPVRYIQNFRAMINLTKNGSAVPYMGGKDSFGGGFYSYSVGMAIKGLEIELVKIFTLLTSIDLSDNKFEGEIPKDIGKLNSLKGLNFSHNSLSGYIPTSIGNLTNLEWMDLSSNKLVGEIPQQLLELTSLSFLNVSENELVGCIPRGKQFNTFENNSYFGNNGLRGFPLSRDCDNNEPPQPPPPSNLFEVDDQSESNFSFSWKIVAIGYGCGVMFGLAVGYVVFRTGKPKWVVSLVENHQDRRRRKSKTGNRRGGVRRA